MECLRLYIHVYRHSTKQYRQSTFDIIGVIDARVHTTIHSLSPECMLWLLRGVRALTKGLVSHPISCASV